MKESSIKKQLHKLYVEERLTQKQTSKILNICLVRVVKYMKKYGIKARKPKEYLTGKPKSADHKKKISESKKGKNNPNYGKKCKTHGKRIWYLCPDGKNVSMRSSWEAAYAEFLDNKKIKWSYEPKTFILKIGKAYTPDFYLHETGEWIEVKGWMTEMHKKIISEWLVDFPDEKITIADKKYLTNLGIDLRKIWISSKPKFNCDECKNLFYKKEPNQKLCSVKCRNKFVAKIRCRDKKTYSKTEDKKQKRKYNGNQSGEKNNGSKFSKQDIEIVKKMRESGMTYKEISNVTKMSPTNIFYVCKGKSWKKQ